MAMNKVEIQGRRFYLTPHGWQPSSTTLLKDTKPFNRTFWKKSLMEKGITAHAATLYIEAYANMKQISITESLEIIGTWIGAPMPEDETGAYMDWKKISSSERGNTLHKFLEDTLPLQTELSITEKPEAPDLLTNNLLESLWKAGVLQDISFINSVEKSTYWYNPVFGGGFAGTEDINYISRSFGKCRGDWKTKEPKKDSPTKTASEHKLQLVSYAGADVANGGESPDHLIVAYPFTDGSPAAMVKMDKKEQKKYWEKFLIRVGSWWDQYGEDWDLWNSIEELAEDNKKPW
jgi:hypothetical protein